MRYGVATVFAAVGALAACQVTPNEETAIQANDADYCQAKMPEVTQWDESPVEPAGEIEAWVVWPNELELSATGGQEWLAALVNNKEANVVAAFHLSDDQLKKFATYIINGRIGGPGTDPPPPPCRIPQLCGQMLAAYGQTLQGAADAAFEKALACDQK